MARKHILLFADLYAKFFNVKEIFTNVLQYAITVLQFSVFKQGKIIAKLRRRIFCFNLLGGIALITSFCHPEKESVSGKCSNKGFF